MSKVTSLSVRKIAELSGLSTATVSRAFNDSYKVSRSAQQKIQKVLEEYGAAGTMNISAPHVIGFVCPSSKSDYYLSLLSHITNYCDQRGDSVVTYFVDEQKTGGNNALQVLKSLHVDAIIAISFQNNNLKNVELNIPIVWIDSNDIEDDEQCWVTSDQYTAGKMAADILIAKGCKKPIIITGQGDSPRSKLRNQGFNDALKAHSIPPMNDNVVHTPIIVNPFDEGREAVLYYYTKGIGFDGIFAINDLRAIGAYTAVKDLGLNIPEDIKLIGFDGISLSTTNIYQITSIQQNTLLLAHNACEMIYKKINKQPIEHKHIIVPIKVLNGTTV